jgi:glucosamine--fructose-6-phosphate aminotransferase (isomerizing)
MCGIIGYLGNTECNESVLNGLRLLMNRGYDSIGISTIINGELSTIKYANDGINELSIDSLEQQLSRDTNTSNIGIGHTRWATHGSKTAINAHPHADNKHRISLVHNGIIENYAELKRDLLNEGYTFLSQTDTEVISVMIGKYLDNGDSMITAIENTINRLSGTWALVVLNKDFPNKIWITRNGSPLLLGMEDEYVIIASEQIAFGNKIKNYIVLDNHDIFDIERQDSGKITYSRDIRNYILKTKVEQGIIETYPTGYDYWMIKEIYEQPEAVNRATNNGGRIKDDNSVKLCGLDTHISDLYLVKHLILLGCGTSYNAGLWSIPFFKNMELFQTVNIYDGAEFTTKDIITIGKTGVIFLSQSGETKDLHRCLSILNEKPNIITIGVINVVDSMIARETDCGVYLNTGREVAVASTKSFTNQCVVLGMIIIWFSQIKTIFKEKRIHMITDVMNLSFQIREILHQDLIQLAISHFTEKWHNMHSMFLLGKGCCEAIAREGALKIKEVAYIHAEGYSSSALKHGPFALIEEGLPIIIIDIGNEYREKNKNAMEEVKSRGADIWLLTDDKRIEPSQNVYVTNIIENNTFGALNAGIVIQYFSYKMALKRGYNPDYPRNLAKVVTVE